MENKSVDSIKVQLLNDTLSLVGLIINNADKEGRDINTTELTVLKILCNRKI